MYIFSTKIHNFSVPLFPNIRRQIPKSYSDAWATALSSLVDAITQHNRKLEAMYDLVLLQTIIYLILYQYNSVNADIVILFPTHICRTLLGGAVGH